MARSLAVTCAVVLVSMVGILTARATATKSDFQPALAAELVTAAAAVGILSETATANAGAADGVQDFLDATADLRSSAGAVTDTDVVTPATQVETVPAAPVVVVAAPVRTAAPQPVRTAAPVPPAPAPVATPTTCPATWFCYPRLGIAGPIVPYTDCSGSTDVGTAIRSYNCLSDHYLMGHAYTQFGLVRQWAAGDIVFAWGQRFTVSGAVTQQSCGTPSFPLATLSMQTSLTSSACGAVLVVQAR